MLTIKKPMTLQTNKGLLSVNEGFCQRLVHGYSMMTAHIAPKDLLFLLTAPMEFPEDFGNNTSLNLQNNVTNLRQVTIDVVNNIVNRIMLEQYSPFTYQDQVYLTTTLHKLGVTDVQYFMDEVRKIRKEQHNTASLQALYEKTLSLSAVQQVITEGTATKTSQESSGDVESVPPQAPRYYLHEEIYNRLQTGDVYNQVVQFQSNQLSSPNYIENKALLLSEQLRLTQNIATQQYKNQLFQREEMTLHYHSNHFETGEQLPTPVSEEEVLGQASQAALFATIQQVMTHVVGEGKLEKETWIPLDHNVARMAENTLNRFELFHSETYVHGTENREYQQLYQDLRQEELDYLQKFSQSVHVYESHLYGSKTVDIQEFHGSPIMEHPSTVEGDTVHLEENQTIQQTVEAFDIAHITEQMLQKTVTQKVDKTANTKETQVELLQVQKERRQEVETRSLQQWHMLHELQSLERELVMLQQESPRVTQVDLQHSLTQVQSVVESTSLERTLLQQTELMERHHTELQLQHGETVEKETTHTLATSTQLETENTTSQTDMTKHNTLTTALTEQFSQSYEREEYHTKEQFSTTELQHSQRVITPNSEESLEGATKIQTSTSPLQEKTPSIANAVELLRETRRQIETRVEQASGFTLQENVEYSAETVHQHNSVEGEGPPSIGVQPPQEDMAALEKHLDALDRENRIKLEQLRHLSTHSQAETIRHQGVDSKRMMQDALRAISSPEEVLMSLDREYAEAPAKMDLPKNVEWILQQADPATREIYESIIKYQQNPESGGNQLLKPTTLSHLQGDLQAISQSAPIPMEHLPLFPEETVVIQEEGRKSQMVSETLEDLSGKQMKTTGKVGSGWGKTSMVYKQEGNTVMEELTEWLDSREKKSVQQETVENVVSKQTTNQTVFQDDHKEIITQSTQDISELVNRTLAKQMGTITDQVYQQMERKLQQERSRRGR